MGTTNVKIKNILFFSDNTKHFLFTYFYIFTICENSKLKLNIFGGNKVNKLTHDAAFIGSGCFEGK